MPESLLDETNRRVAKRRYWLGKGRRLFWGILGHMICGTFDRDAWSIHHMGVDHGCLNVLMSEQFLNRSDIGTVFEKMRGETVS